MNNLDDVTTALQADPVSLVGRLRKLEEENKVMLGLLRRFFYSGSSLGFSHPHLAAYVTFPRALWDETWAVLDASKNE